jgi:xanthine dehydrogenase/oxidase
VYKNDGPYDAYVDVTQVPELYHVSSSTPMTVGGAVTLTNLLETLSTIAATNDDYWYGSILAEHIGKIGSVPLRNVRIFFFLNSYILADLVFRFFNL